MQLLTADSVQRDIMQLAEKLHAVLPQSRDDVACSVSAGALAAAFGMLVQSLPPSERPALVHMHAKLVRLSMSMVKA